MTKLKYKDKDGFWQEFQVGTNVVANPMLTGTEQELTSLQVGNAKYKIGGGKLYRHNIFANWQDITTNIRLDILKDSNTKISQSEFQTYVSTFTIISVGSLTGSGVGTIYYDSHEYNLIAVVADTRNTNAPQILNLSKGTFDSFTDTVTEL